jgi:predicted DNA-binding transcriptional regulator AlpA
MVLLRFRDLRSRGVVLNRVTLANRIKNDGFPPGRMLGPNERAWTDQEIDDWIASRPVAGPVPRGAAGTRRGRPPRKIPAITGLEA